MKAMRWILPVLAMVQSHVASGAQTGPAAGDWPTTNQWRKMYCGANPATDLVADGTGTVGEKDLVGDFSRPAAWYSSNTSYLFVRMRLEGKVTNNTDTKLRPFSWSFGFDTDGARTVYDWVWSVNGGSGASQDVMHLYRISEGSGPNSLNPTEVTDTEGATPTGYPNGGYPLDVGGVNSWVRFSDAPSSFDGSADDDFLDIAVPIQDFQSVSAIVGPPNGKSLFNPGVLTMWVATSATGGQLNKDFLCWNDRNGEPVLSKVAPQPIGIGVSGFGIITYPAHGSTIYVTNPVITGTANPSSTFNLSDGTTTVSVTSDPNGNWTYLAPAGWGWQTGQTETLTLSNTGWASTSNTFTIACPDGTTFTGGSCVDINECTAITNGGCGAHATCTNANPGRTCACDDGYIGDGFTCVAVTSFTVLITSPANGSQISTLTPTVSGTAIPSTTVTLKYGINTTTVTSNGSGNWSFNVPTTWGLQFGMPAVTFIASVPSGVTSSTTVSIICGLGTFVLGETCEDIDECVDNNGGCSVNATCTNAATSGDAPSCVCNAGFHGNGVDCNADPGSVGPDTITIDNPITGSIINSTVPAVNGSCSVTNFNLASSANSTPLTASSGSWNSTISRDWNWRFGSTVVLTASIPSGGSALAVYTLLCATGYEPDTGGGSCVDVNECDNTNVCPTGLDCNNTVGSFLCVDPLAPTPTPTPTPTTEVTNDSSSEPSQNLGPDTDSDGIPDAVDNCKYIKNPDQIESMTENVGAACNSGDNNAASEKEILGLKAVGSGCARSSSGSNNGIGTLIFGHLLWFGFRRSRRKLRSGCRKFIPFLMLGLAVPLAFVESGEANAASGSLDVEQFDAVLPGAGLLNQPYGRLDSVESKWMIGAGVQYSIQPLRLVPAVPDDPRVGGDVVPALLRWEILARRMLGSYADVQLAVPYVDTIGTPDWTIGGRTMDQLQASSPGDARLSLGIDLLKIIRRSTERRPTGFGLALRTTAWIPVGGEKTVAALHGEEKRRYEPRLVADYVTDEGIHFGLGIGHHIREESQILNVVNGRAWRWGLYAEVPVLENAKIATSLFGAEQTARQIDPQDPDLRLPSNVFSPREFMGGFVFDHGRFITTWAGGVGLNGSVGSPYRRYLAQIAYAPGKVPTREAPKRDEAKPLPVVIPCRAGEVCERVLVAELYFETASDHIRVAEAEKVWNVLSQIRDDEEIAAITIQGRTDNRGSKAYNMALSARRADSVIQMLAATGIPRKIMKSSAFGFEKPVADNKDETGRQRNRQVDVRFTIVRK